MSVVLTIPGGRPKRDIIELAHEFCGLAGFEFEHSPEEIGSALRKLDLMMTEWPWDQLGYNAPVDGKSVPEDASGLADKDVPAVYMHLAMLIAPALGKALSSESKTAMREAFDRLSARYSSVPRGRYAPRTPRGSGRYPTVPYAPGC